MNPHRLTQGPVVNYYCYPLRFYVYLINTICIKVRFKMRETNCKILNIFANSHVIHEISIVMDSKYYVDNFQPVFVAKTAKFYMKK